MLGLRSSCHGQSENLGGSIPVFVGGSGNSKAARLFVAALQVSLATTAAVSIYLRFESFLGNPLSSTLMMLSFGSAWVAVIDRNFGRHP
jgi:hypothetical protein